MIYLASQSPRRAELLRQVQVAFEILPPDADEDTESLESERLGESPTQYVTRVTRAKALAAYSRIKRNNKPFKPILVSDTTVALGGTIYAKPRDAQHAQKILQALSGKTHRVLTAVAIVTEKNQSPYVQLKLSRSRIRFKKLKVSEIENYIATQEPFGKAGAYAIQGLAAQFIMNIEGSYSGIMGLPLFETMQLLKPILK
jgi:septum formation protein